MRSGDPILPNNAAATSTRAGRRLRRKTSPSIALMLGAAIAVALLGMYITLRPAWRSWAQRIALVQAPITRLPTFDDILTERHDRPNPSSLDGTCYVQAYNTAYLAGSQIYAGVYVMAPGTQTWRYFPYKSEPRGNMVVAVAGGSADAPLVVTNGNDGDDLNWKLQRLSPTGPPTVLSTWAVRQATLPISGNFADYSFHSPLVGSGWSAGRLRITLDGGKTWSAQTVLAFLRKHDLPAGLPQEDAVRSLCWLSDRELAIGTEDGVRLMAVDRGTLRTEWSVPQPFDQPAYVRPLGESAVFAYVSPDQFLVLDRVTGRQLAQLKVPLVSPGCLETDGNTVYVCDDVSITKAHLRSFLWTGNRLTEQPMIVIPQALVLLVHRHPMLLICWDRSDGTKQDLFALVNGKLVPQPIMVQKMPNGQGP